MTPSAWASIAAIVISAVAGLLVYRLNRLLDGRESARDKQTEGLETRLRAVELNIAGDLMTKEDGAQLVAQLNRLGETLGVVKDMVLRLDEREKVRHGQG